MSKSSDKKAAEVCESGGLLLADGFEEAFMGVTVSWETGEEVAVYDTAKCLGILMYRDGMDYEEATEFFGFNVAGAYVGAHTPVFVQRSTLEEALDGIS